MLEGKNVNLRVVEKEDLPLWADWNNNLENFGEFMWFPQNSRTELEKRYENLTPDNKWFFIEKKDGTKIGGIIHFLAGSLLEIGYLLAPSERRKGYCSEAVMIMVDYLFLSKNIARIQAHADVGNEGSQKTLERAGFKKEGKLCQSFFMRGELRDAYVYSILREEWKEPKMLGRQ